MGATEWDDPHGILPECFRRQYADCESVEEALTTAELQPSTTPEAEQRQCKVCGSRRVRKKIKRREMEHRRPEKFVCVSCGKHQDDPITPNDPDTMHGTATHDDRKPFDWIGKSDLKDPDERAPPLSQLDDEMLTTLAIRAYEPWSEDGCSYSEIAAVLPYSRWWVGERIREWKRGEYRELVADPREQPSVDDTPTVDPFDYGRAVATDGGRRRRRWVSYGRD